MPAARPRMTQTRRLEQRQHKLGSRLACCLTPTLWLFLGSSRDSYDLSCTPFDSSTRVPCMNFEPLLAGAPVMVMLSPGFMVVLVHPLWRRKLGLLISIAHSRS